MPPHSPTPMQRTPQPVLDAMFVIAEHLKKEGYEQIVIGKNGGASFRLTSVFADMRQLYEEIDRLCAPRGSSDLRLLLVDCDSELSAIAHGRPPSDKATLLDMAHRCRQLKDRQ